MPFLRREGGHDWQHGSEQNHVSPRRTLPVKHTGPASGVPAANDSFFTTQCKAPAQYNPSSGMLELPLRRAGGACATLEFDPRYIEPGALASIRALSPQQQPASTAPVSPMPPASASPASFASTPAKPRLSVGPPPPPPPSSPLQQHAHRGAHAHAEAAIREVVEGPAATQEPVPVSEAVFDSPVVRDHPTPAPAGMFATAQPSPANSTSNGVGMHATDAAKMACGSYTQQRNLSPHAKRALDSRDEAIVDANRQRESFDPQYVEYKSLIARLDDIEVALAEGTADKEREAALQYEGLVIRRRLGEIAPRKRVVHTAEIPRTTRPQRTASHDEDAMALWRHYGIANKTRPVSSVAWQRHNPSTAVEPWALPPRRVDEGYPQWRHDVPWGRIQDL
eukprot:TRINITY_DN9456_c0_g1_i1.p1 TRINITY_DN9456_c0_g1~~TRINITY_DN9456_c0_g1_i1.p1  ORF type:complete len:394 (+),score=61.32 TRINITY_DN9456_c0_g1_i1:54-1235(+)